MESLCRPGVHEGNFEKLTPVLLTGLSSRVFHQDPPHRFGTAPKKCPRLFQCSAFSTSTSRIYASWTSAVACSVLPWLLVGKPLGRQATKFLIDQRQELLGCRRVALIDGTEDACDVGHRRGPRRPPRSCPTLYHGVVPISGCHSPDPTSLGGTPGCAASRQPDIIRKRPCSRPDA